MFQNTPYNFFSFDLQASQALTSLTFSPLVKLPGSLPELLLSAFHSILSRFLVTGIGFFIVKKLTRIEQCRSATRARETSLAGRGPDSVQLRPPHLFFSGV